MILRLKIWKWPGWEGKLFVDFSKDAEVVQKECPDKFAHNLSNLCLMKTLIKKLEQEFYINFNKRSAISMEMFSSKLFDSYLN